MQPARSSAPPTTLLPPSPTFKLALPPSWKKNNKTKTFTQIKTTTTRRNKKVNPVHVLIITGWLQNHRKCASQQLNEPLSDDTVGELGDSTTFGGRAIMLVPPVNASFTLSKLLLQANVSIRQRQRHFPPLQMHLCQQGQM